MIIPICYLNLTLIHWPFWPSFWYVTNIFGGFTKIFDPCSHLSLPWSSMLHASSGIGGNQASREIPPYKIWNAFTLHYNLEIYAKGFVSSFLHHHHNQSIKCLMFDLLTTQLSETADRQVWPGRSSAVAAPHCPGRPAQPARECRTAPADFLPALPRTLDITKPRGV